MHRIRTISIVGSAAAHILALAAVLKFCPERSPELGRAESEILELQLAPIIELIPEPLTQVPVTVDKAAIVTETPSLVGQGVFAEAPSTSGVSAIHVVEPMLERVLVESIPIPNRGTLHDWGLGEPKENPGQIVSRWGGSQSSGAEGDRSWVCASYSNTPDPVYPKAAVSKRLEGVVLLGVTVSAIGTPTHIRLVESSGHDLLDRAALDTVARWQFRPALRNKMPVESEVEVPVRFKLRTG